ncbi:hypothetical protein KFE25_004822 [Diacronema lutheri]|uniref:PIPK domain-containing protein n=1 Tax=Diacronema lutheri TaxID=2081491 RepID=A0A8J6C9S2_DIALT|nr:hypothetical protein KFE25_004822 [Diacronema lutheri]
MGAAMRTAASWRSGRRPLSPACRAQTAPASARAAGDGDKRRQRRQRRCAASAGRAPPREPRRARAPGGRVGHVGALAQRRFERLAPACERNSESRPDGTRHYARGLFERVRADCGVDAAEYSRFFPPASAVEAAAFEASSSDGARWRSFLMESNAQNAAAAAAGQDGRAGDAAAAAAAVAAILKGESIFVVVRNFLPATSELAPRGDPPPTCSAHPPSRAALNPLTTFDLKGATVNRRALTDSKMRGRGLARARAAAAACSHGGGASARCDARDGWAGAAGVGGATSVIVSPPSPRAAGPLSCGRPGALSSANDGEASGPGGSGGGTSRPSRAPAAHASCAYGTLRDLEWVETAQAVHLSAAERDELRDTLERDVAMLARAGMVDHSLLVGVAHVPAELAGEEKEALLAALRRAGGRVSRHRQTIYFIGLIDCLSAWGRGWKAQGLALRWAHAALCLPGLALGITAPPPELYAERFLTFVNLHRSARERAAARRAAAIGGGPHARGARGVVVLSVGVARARAAAGADPRGARDATSSH